MTSYTKVVGFFQNPPKKKKKPNFLNWYYFNYTKESSITKVGGGQNPWGVKNNIISTVDCQSTFRIEYNSCIETAVEHLYTVDIYVHRDLKDFAQ